MRALSAAASLLVWLALVLLAPTAQADCPHNNKTDHPHCNGGGESQTLESLNCSAPDQIAKFDGTMWVCADDIADLQAQIDDLQAQIDALSIRTVFISSQTYDGALGGLVGADAECQQLADDAFSIVPPGTGAGLQVVDPR